MLTRILIALLASSWAALLVYGCGSRSQGNSETTHTAAEFPSNPVPNAQNDLQQQILGRTILKAQSGAIEIEWTTTDLFSKSTGKVERIWQPLAQRGYEEFLADVNRSGRTEGRVNNCDYRRDFKVLSIVGSLLSFQDEEYSDCGGAHPTTEMRFTAIDIADQGEVFYGQEENSFDADLSRSSKVAKLTDYFTESEILSALLADRIIKQALADAGVSSVPQTLAALPEVFARDDYVLSGTELALRPDFLTRFAFHHVEGDMVAVRLNLPSIAFAYRSHQIGLLLKIPTGLQQQLALAATKREGFLMREAPPSISNDFTRFSFKLGEGAKHGN